MMRRISLVLTATAMMSTMMAQNNEQIHIFRNDKQFNTYHGADVKSITFEGKDEAYRNMIVTTASGKTETLSMSVIDSCVVRSTGIPELHVNLTDYPNWTELQGAKDDVRAATIYMDGNGMYDDLPSQSVEFRGRGNSTWNMRKKPYRFKMAKKASVCGLPKAKTFALIANNIDCTLMRNVVALWIANYLEMPYSNHWAPVKVYLNGHNKGQYMMTEKIGIGGGSVDIDETTGMLFEMDSNYDEDYKFRYYFYRDGKYCNMPVMVKDPDLAELAADVSVPGITNANAYFEKWKSDFTTMANALTQRNASQSLSDVIDIESAVNFFLVNAIANNHELEHPKSFYIHKKTLGTDEVYHFGPVWDFDWSFTYDGKEGTPYDRPLVKSDRDCSGASFLKYLFANTEFRTKFEAKLKDFYDNGYPKLCEFMEQYATMIEPSAKENGVLWPSYTHASWCIVTGSYEFRDNYNTLKKWIDDRVKFMLNDTNFGLYP